MAPQGMVPVTRRALIQRINRKLAADDQVLKATRGDTARSELGDFYILNYKRNWLMEKRIDLEKLGRKEGVLQAWERLQGVEE
jgi:hypothetical protein